DTPNKPPHKLEMDFMREIREASFLYVADVDGYVGKSAGTEMAYAKLKGLPVICAETIQKFSDEIPQEAQNVLRKIVAGILPISEISKDKIDNLKNELVNSDIAELTEEERKILSPLIKELLRELKNIPQK
ncbi:MAG: hypothetical protein AAB723_03160, partial [Patescibacteria group bacterium]